VIGVIAAVVFDAGECLIDKTREYGTWADCWECPPHVLSVGMSAASMTTVAIVARSVLSVEKVMCFEADPTGASS
jgi:hypothetical protein